MPYQILVRDDCTEAMKRLPDASVHSVVCDPPYHLTSIVERFGKADAAPVKVPEGGTGAYARASRGFMGKVWDGGDVAFRVSTWEEAYRVLKPGGHLLAFGGTRTYHRMACAIEDAGFEVRDSIHYCFGSGFPKSKDVALGIDKGEGHPNRGRAIPTASTHLPGGKYAEETLTSNPVEAYEPKSERSAKWKGWGTALKPSHEVIVLARKPLDGTVAKNVLTHGTGALNIDATRVPHGAEVDLDTVQRQQHSEGSIDGAFGAANLIGKEIPTYKPEGRWPANTLLQHAPGCDEECVEGCPVLVMDEQSGGDGASRYFNVFTLEPGEYAPFFYTPKASRKEREAGCENIPVKSGAEAVGREEGSAGMNSPLAGAGRTAKTVHNDHPTIKSIALMEWCVKLVTPPEGVVLDPFMGSGSTGIAALRSGFNFIGMEMDEHYMEIAEARITHHGGTPEVIR